MLNLTRSPAVSDASSETRSAAASVVPVFSCTRSRASSAFAADVAGAAAPSFHSVTPISARFAALGEVDLVARR